LKVTLHLGSKFARAPVAAVSAASTAAHQKLLLAIAER
jgi:hypothetical protein